jgi:pimeloyl-ACP methyl ester carboxylesterase
VVAGRPAQSHRRSRPSLDVRIASEKAQLAGRLYGKLPARRAAILCHGANWDASGWAEIAPRFEERGVPALALNFRGYGRSTGSNNRRSAVVDVVSAAVWLKAEGAGEVALVGASMGGHAVLMASAEVRPESVVAISAPVRAIPAEEAQRIKGRKLFVCAERDFLGAAAAVRQAYEDAAQPKDIRLFPGREHSRAMFEAPYGEEALRAILDFVSSGL